MTNILTICTGNICRSPVAELLLQQRLGDLADVSSAGVRALVDKGIPAELLISLDGVDTEGRSHRARQLTGELTREADLIIVMTSAHRSEVVRESPDALRRTFLLDEIAKAARAHAPLEGSTPAERLANIATAIQDFRPELAGLGVEDIPDPYRRSQKDYDLAFAMIEAAVQDIDVWVRQ